jgi:L-ascorbate metabolism protein UlaG (beta-lactamase superfamily)
LVADPPVRLGVTYVGHATVLLETDGLRCLTDPFLRDRLGPLRRHGPAPDAAAIGSLDLVLVSHAHPDHFDPWSLRHLRGDPLVIVPLGLGRAAQRTGRRVRALAVGESAGVGDWTVTAVPARHPRWPLHARARAVGYILEGPSTIYFAGDTGPYPEMAALRGRADLALLPVGRWGPHRSPGHLDPASAADVAALIEARVAVPIHWGTLYPRGLHRAWPHPLDRPAPAFAAALADVARECEACILEPGSSANVSLPARIGPDRAGPPPAHRSVEPPTGLASARGGWPTRRP